MGFPPGRGRLAAGATALALVFAVPAAAQQPDPAPAGSAPAPDAPPGTVEPAAPRRSRWRLVAVVPQPVSAGRAAGDPAAGAPRVVPARPRPRAIPAGARAAARDPRRGAGGGPRRGAGRRAASSARGAAPSARFHRRRHRACARPRPRPPGDGLAGRGAVGRRARPLRARVRGRRAGRARAQGGGARVKRRLLIATIVAATCAAAPGAASAEPLVNRTCNGSLICDVWFRGPVAIDWSFTGTPTGCVDETIRDDTPGTLRSCLVMDGGESASKSVTIKLDQTAPIISGRPGSPARPLRLVHAPGDVRPAGAPTRHRSSPAATPRATAARTPRTRRWSRPAGTRPATRRRARSR